MLGQGKSKRPRCLFPIVKTMIGLAVFAALFYGLGWLWEIMGFLLIAGWCGIMVNYVKKGRAAACTGAIGGGIVASALLFVLLLIITPAERRACCLGHDIILGNLLFGLPAGLLVGAALGKWLLPRRDGEGEPDDQFGLGSEGA